MTNEEQNTALYPKMFVQKVNALHADRLACSAPALNGEMCSSGAGSRRCCAVFSLPVEALFPRMAFRFCLLVHPYPL